MNVTRISDGKEGKIIWIDRICSETVQYQVQYQDEIRWQSIDEIKDYDEILISLPTGKIV